MTNIPNSVLLNINENWPKFFLDISHGKLYQVSIFFFLIFIKIKNDIKFHFLFRIKHAKRSKIQS